MEQTNTETQKKTLDDFKGPEVFEVISKMDISKIKAAYGVLMVFGPQTFGQETTDRNLSLLTYELNRRENEETKTQNQKDFKYMTILTWLSISVAASQWFLQFIDFMTR